MNGRKEKAYRLVSNVDAHLDECLLGGWQARKSLKSIAMMVNERTLPEQINTAKTAQIAQGPAMIMSSTFGLYDMVSGKYS